MRKGLVAGTSYRKSGKAIAKGSNYLTTVNIADALAQLIIVHSKAFHSCLFHDSQDQLAYQIIRVVVDLIPLKDPYR